MSGAIGRKFTVISPGATFMLNLGTTHDSSSLRSKRAGMGSVPVLFGMATGEL